MTAKALTAKQTSLVKAIVGAAVSAAFAAGVGVNGTLAATGRKVDPDAVQAIAQAATSAAVRETAEGLRQERRDDLRHYVTKEEFLRELDARFDRFEDRLVARLRARE